MSELYPDPDPYWTLSNDAYIWAAESYCGECVRQQLFDQDLVESDANRADMTAAQAVASAMRARGYNSQKDYDSSELPKGPFEDGGGEADVPCNCCKCGKFLENPLTETGYHYVAEQIAMNPDLPVSKAWREFYSPEIADYLPGGVHSKLPQTEPGDPRQEPPGFYDDKGL